MIYTSFFFPRGFLQISEIFFWNTQYILDFYLLLPFQKNYLLPFDSVSMISLTINIQMMKNKIARISISNVQLQLMQ